MDVIRHLDPRPGLRYSGPGARQVEPDVYISKDGDDYLIQINDDDIPQLRLNPQYRRMLDRDQEPQQRSSQLRQGTLRLGDPADEEYRAAQADHPESLPVHRAAPADFLEHGIDQLKPMMIKEIAEEIGVHPSTVSRAVSSKYAHTPQGVFELRYFFSEAVQGPAAARRRC